MEGNPFTSPGVFEPLSIERSVTRRANKASTLDRTSACERE